MGFEHRKATIADLDILVETRLEVLRVVNKLDDNEDMSEIVRESYKYYREALGNGLCTVYLVFDGDKVIGTGGISYYSIMPTYHDPTGRKGYIMNMYTKPEYRRQGIAAKTLDLLVKDAKEHGITVISLEATDMGRKLYEKYGFVDMKCEMELPEQTKCCG